jgi:hypothetical protein
MSRLRGLADNNTGYHLKRRTIVECGLLYNCFKCIPCLAQDDTIGLCSGLSYSIWVQPFP